MALSKRHISKEEVEHVAWLARLELSEEEKELYTQQFNDILDYFQKLNELDTEGVPPTLHVLELVNVFRKDEVKPSLPPEEALANAPRKRGRFFEAPRIL
ncbi:Asp-tRNA(Asn)/Glu-tRNA(Gln) amidotransferase subunit GatC [Candidatus Hecatella orcuttiae]|jgi:aspartyl-tRNA(Asn)/glutamyl-tRNA(Gln) amidotransferase subunit C|uniref:Asp-tRNA(Asn)/Glu-tRNA(Gln) amidotransferase subunit GatC n=1 Tax=Candidatus Hecatella orcuttiae TaxID=1935119 RepID=UPI002867C6D2|nr:Asp-tRNA(Asn)/Glu-tRNA(Gln) amidotransferase subunit GatC [Candidatus Hecatella orcuttiae]